MNQTFITAYTKGKCFVILCNVFIFEAYQNWNITFFAIQSRNESYFMNGIFCTLSIFLIIHFMSFSVYIYVQVYVYFNTMQLKMCLSNLWKSTPYLTEKNAESPLHTPARYWCSSDLYLVFFSESHKIHDTLWRHTLLFGVCPIWFHSGKFLRLIDIFIALGNVKR